jgi:hypothetical protein
MVNPMDLIFPKMTKCTFSRYGPSGGGEKIDALCVVPLNVLNEKIFFVLWWLYLILTVHLAFTLIFNVVVYNIGFIRR